MKKKQLLQLLCLICIMVLVSCQKDEEAIEPKPVTVDLETLYQNSVYNAMTADSSYVIDSLWAISSSNPHLKWKEIDGENYLQVANLTAFPDSYKVDSLSNWWGDVWVFIPQQAHQRFSFNPDGSSKDTTMRFKQLLGLPPQKEYTHIAVLWIKSSDLFRPAGDNEIDDKTAYQNLAPNADSAYKAWFDSNLIYSYYGTSPMPWTRMGYTYDWADFTSRVGLSEFCIKPNSVIYVEKLYGFTEFFR